MTEQQFADLFKALHEQTEQLRLVREELVRQGSTGSQTWHHAIDFLVILAADIGAAVVALVTFDSWRERDRQNVERAQSLLNKIGPHLPTLVEFFKKCIASPGVSFGAPWGGSSPMGPLFVNNPELNPGSLAWDFPGGTEFLSAFTDLRDQIKALGGPIGGGENPRVQKLLEAALKIQTIQDKLLKRYTHGPTRTTWNRFFKWIRHTN